jgi:hypothetical protein
VVVKEKDPIIAGPVPPDVDPDWEPEPPALPLKAVLVGLTCAIAVVFFVAVGREFGSGEEQSPFRALQGGVFMGVLTGFVVRCLGGRGLRAIHFVFWTLVAGAVIGNVVGGIGDFQYGCAWAGPAQDLSHAIVRRFDSHFGFGLLGLVAMAIAGVSARKLYENWSNRSGKANG